MNLNDLMQDNAPPYKSAYLITYFHSHEIKLIFWPTFSPDQTPIQAIWSMIKTHIKKRYSELGQEKQRSRLQVHEITKEVWESITPNQLQTLIISIPEIVQAVIEADGSPTKYQSFEQVFVEQKFVLAFVYFFFFQK